jgi:transposase-like protein
MTMSDVCPECRSQQFKKNGHIHNGKQHHQCKDCGRPFVVDATHRVIDEEQRLLVERLLCEKISLRGICRALRMSSRWLMDFMVARFASFVSAIRSGNRESLFSFVTFILSSASTVAPATQRPVG